MKVLIKSVQILDPSSKWHLKEANVLIEGNTIKEISTNNLTATQVIEGKGLTLSPGWFDMRATIGDPGLEHREDIASACEAASFGGFTEIACLPATQPFLQSKDVVAYIKSKSQISPVEIHPIANVTTDAKGLELTEMIDLHEAGVVAFCDGEHPVWHSGVLIKALQYLQPMNGLLIQNAEDTNLTKYGQMNEGRTSTILGLKGIPKIAEEVVILNNLELLKYSGGRIHFSKISTARSVEIIRNAKKKGLNVTCDIAAHQIAFDDSALTSFDTSYKVNPPFRNKEDIDALLKGLIDDTIDVVVSDHTPLDPESKNLEFDMASFGIINLETAFAVANTYAGKKVELSKILEKFTSSPRRLLNREQVIIEEGAVANLTLFDAEKEWTYTEKDIKSKSRNSPFTGKKLKGKAVAVFNKGQVKLLS